MVRLSNLPLKQGYLPAKKSKAQRLSNDSVAVQRFTGRYGSDVARSTQKKGAKRKGLLSRLASEGYRG